MCNRISQTIAYDVRNGKITLREAEIIAKRNGMNEETIDGLHKRFERHRLKKILNPYRSDD
jgi:hypothetical protein